jgi:hypothetical protein
MFNLRKNLKKKPMHHILFRTLSFFVLFTLLQSCSQDPLKVDVSHIEAPISILRFEQDLLALKEFANDDAAFLNAVTQLNNKYPNFLADWLQAPELMGIGPLDNPETLIILKEIARSSSYEWIVSKINAQFGDFSHTEKELKKAYQHFLYYFPNEKIPSIITYTANFSLTLNPVGKDYIGIALDMHLGDTFGLYTQLQPPLENYFIKLLTPESIAVLQMIAHGRDLFHNYYDEAKFSTVWFFWGKLLYFTEAMLPDVPKHLLIGYTEEEYTLALQEEKNIWSYFVKENMLYETDKKRFMRHFVEAPFTVAPNVPPDMPSQLGKFSAWQAVRQFMQKNPTVSLPTLMNMTDADAFLRKAKYKP